MPGPLDPFTPGLDMTPNAGVDPGTFDKLRGEWGAFLSDPRGRAAIMSAGLALTAPPSFGDNNLSQIGRAFGAMGESGRVMEAQSLKRDELDSKDAMREAQAQARLMTAGAAEQRAEAASARAGAAGERAGFQMQRLEDMRSRSNLQGRLRALMGYQNYLKNEGQAKFLDPNRPPPMDRDTWLKSMGLGDILGPPGADDGDAISAIPPAANTTSAPQAPTNPTDRKPNTVYNTPKGPLKWTGTGWVSP